MVLRFTDLIHKLKLTSTSIYSKVVTVCTLHKILKLKCADMSIINV